MSSEAYQAALRAAESSLKKQFLLRLESEHVAQCYHRALRQKASQVKLSGFRPGKAPLAMVQNLYGHQVEQTALRNALQEACAALIKDKGLKLAAPPAIQSSQQSGNEGLAFQVEVEVLPDIKLTDLHEIKVKKYLAEFDENDTDVLLDRMRHQLATYKPSRGKVKWGDRITLAPVAPDSETNTEKASSETSSRTIWLHPSLKGNAPLDMEALIGLKKGEKVQLASKLFKEEALSIEQVYTPKLPDLDEAFCRQLGIQSGKIEDLKVQAAKQAQQVLKLHQWRSLTQNLFEALTEKYTFDVPKSRLEAALAELLEEQVAEPLASEIAIKRARYRLLIEHVIEKYQLAVNPSRVLELLEEKASIYEEPQKIIQAWKRDQAVLRQLSSHSLEEAAIEILSNKVTLECEPISFFNLTFAIEQDPVNPIHSLQTQA